MKTKSFKEILKETIQRNCTDDYDGMFLFFESSVIEAHNEYASQFQQEWIPVEVRLPEYGEEVFTTVKFENDEPYVYQSFLRSNERWAHNHGFVIAWKPKPQPYNPTQS